MRLQNILGSFISRLNRQNIISKRFLKIKTNNYLIVNKSFYCKKDLAPKINHETSSKAHKPISKFYSSVVLKGIDFYC